MERIGIDLDDVVVPFVPVVIDWHNRNYGTSIKLSDFKHYGFSEVFRCEHHDTQKRIREFFDHRDFRTIAPFDECMPVLQGLRGRCGLDVVTSRLGYMEEHTIEQVKRSFGGLFSEIYFCNHHDKTKPISTKGDLCREKNIGLIVEDNYPLAHDWAIKGVDVILFDRNGEYGWSKGELLPNMSVARSWNEVSEQIEIKLKK